MGKNEKNENKTENKIQSFPTIDDALQISTDLNEILIKLSEFKYPLEVRKIGKGVRNMSGKERESRKIEIRSKTYYFDLLTAKNGNQYLKITESRSKGEGKEEERSSIIIFEESAKEFADAVSDMVSKLE